MKRLALLAAILISLLAPASAEALLGRGKDLALDLTGGIPQLLGIQGSYFHPYFAIGAGFGGAPVHGLISNNVKLDPVAISSGGAVGDFTIYPGAAYELSQMRAFGRVFPFAGKLFLELSYSVWSFSANMVADLRNDTIDTTIRDFITADLSMKLPYIGLATGYQIRTKVGFFVDLIAGLGWCNAPKTLLSLGGVAMTAGADPDSAIADDIKAGTDRVESEIRKVADDITRKLKIVPFASVGIGFAF